MTKMYCLRHNKKHISESGWRYTKWETETGFVWGWACANVRYPEFTTNQIKEDRLTYANDMLQSHRGGELSREFLEAHPNRAKQMIRDGAITKEEVKKSKYVWHKDVPGVTKKLDAEALTK